MQRFKSCCIRTTEVGGLTVESPAARHVHSNTRDTDVSCCDETTYAPLSAFVPRLHSKECCEGVFITS